MITRALLIGLFPALCFAQTVHVGSKRFTESYILGEILTQTVRQAGEAPAVHKQGLGNTAIVFAALKGGSIDLYPEYTGTVAFELLGGGKSPDLGELNRALKPSGVGADVLLGFNNTYALAMSEKRAASLGVKTISDLTPHGDLKLGLSQEFLNRKDGWQALKTAYALAYNPRGLDHGLAYEALAAGQVDVIDVYTTDAKIVRYGIRVLQDDRRFFPAYDAVVLYRLDFPQRFPRSWSAIKALEGRITAPTMVAMNAEVELGARSFSAVAQDFIQSGGGALSQGRSTPSERSFLGVLFGPDLGRLTLEHIALVFAALIPAVAVGIPLGICAAYSARAAHWILAAVGLMQTIPALALLAFLITLLGTIGSGPAIVALFLYALLPIVRNTASGLADLPLPLRESAHALGLPWKARLRRIELPLATRSILAGIKTSAVICVGTATIAAFIGAGGYGERIVAGLAVNDTLMLLAGAVPSAVLALAVQWGFDAVDRWLVPAGLRLGNDSGSQ